MLREEGGERVEINLLLPRSGPAPGVRSQAVPGVGEVDTLPELVTSARSEGADGLTPLDPQPLLARLASSYTMQDEHLAHTSGGSAQVRESEITFF